MAVLQKAFNTAMKDPEVLATLEKFRANPAVVVGKEWDATLEGFYGLIDQYGDVFKEALKRK